ncbi:MAG: hypothetical protein Kow0031_03060 [Anaerolineae bacterium]
MDRLDSASQATVNNSETVGEQNSPTVLVVDDDPTNLQIVHHLLSELGIVVKISSSGERALQQLKLSLVDLILLDVMMPGMSGIQTCKRLKSQPHTRNIPVVFMTALTDINSVVGAFEAGGIDYITKPFFNQELVARVKTHLKVGQLQASLELRNAELQQKVLELQTTQHALKQAHDELELRVAERTAELTEMNARLERNIVDQRWTERALRESERRFRHVITSISDHIYVVRLTREGQKRIVYLSPKIEAISGHPQSKFLDNVDYWASFVTHPEDQPTLQQKWAALAGQKNSEVEYRIVRADGKVVWVRDSARVSQEADSLVVYGVISDISPRIRLQERLQAIHNTSHQLTLLHDETAILKRVFEIINDTVDFDQASYGLLSSSDNKLIYRHLTPEGWRQGETLSLTTEKNIGVYVVRSGRPVLIEDARKNRRFVLPQTHPPVISELCVPLKVQERVIGVLHVQSGQPYHFSQGDQLLLKTLADQLAVAIQSARLYKEIENRIAQISALAAAGRAMSSTLDLEAVLSKTMDVARQLLAAEGVAVLLHDSRRDCLYFAAAASPGATHMIGKIVPLENSVAGWSFVKNEPVFITDVTQDPRFFSGIDQATGLITKSLLAVPLVHRQTKIGVLEAANKDSGVFNRGDLEKLETLAYSASIAIANARLFEQVQLGREQLRHLTQEVVNAQEEERQRLSYELHDEVGQTLTSLKLSLELLQGDLTPECLLLDNKIGRAIDLTIVLTQRLRILARSLRPPALDVAGLNGALEDHCFEFAAQVGLEIEYHGQEITGASEPVKIFLYRCVQEALNNVAKHAKASRVSVNLKLVQDTIQLSIEDNGVGFDPEAVMAQLPRLRGIGLLGLQERVELFGGTFAVVSQFGQGTLLTVGLPMEEHDD